MHTLHIFCVHLFLFSFFLNGLFVFDAFSQAKKHFVLLHVCSDVFREDLQRNASLCFSFQIESDVVSLSLSFVLLLDRNMKYNKVYNAIHMNLVKLTSLTGLGYSKNIIVIDMSKDSYGSVSENN